MSKHSSCPRSLTSKVLVFNSSYTVVTVLNTRNKIFKKCVCLDLNINFKHTFPTTQYSYLEFQVDCFGYFPIRFLPRPLEDRRKQTTECCVYPQADTECWQEKSWTQLTLHSALSSFLLSDARATVQLCM